MDSVENSDYEDEDKKDSANESSKLMKIDKKVD